MKHWIVYCSPHGTTRHVASTIEQRLAELGQEAVSLDLGDEQDRRKLDRIAGEADDVCLWVGSPVYADHAVPSANRFIEALPANKGWAAVPFVTWGAVSSGLALHDMGRQLIAKGCALLGAAKVVAVHSFTLQAEQPVACGHPDGQDDAVVQSLVEQVVDRLTGKKNTCLALEKLDYLPPARRERALAKSLAKTKAAFPPLVVDPQRCDGCGTCVAECPTTAIVLDPTPRIGENCMLCLRCVLHCPRQAIPFDFTPLGQKVRGMAAEINETPLTEIFV
jgi:ferredoxin/flavodoxin